MVSGVGAPSETSSGTALLGSDPLHELGVHSIALASFNVWGMPFGSTDVLSRPGRCGMEAADALALAAGCSNTVLCFQEAWAFRCGLAWPLLALARAAERWAPRSGPSSLDGGRALLSQIGQMNRPLTLLALVVATLLSLVFPGRLLRWDGTRDEILRGLAARGLLFAAGAHGSAGMPWCKLMDSGLLIVSSARPAAQGFVAYVATGGLASEGMVTKGFLWALYGSERQPGGQLVVTTHVHATYAAVRLEQCRQLLQAVESLCAQHEPSMTLLCGDFNEPPGGRLHEAIIASPLGLRRLTDASDVGTCRVAGDAVDVAELELDHVYATTSGFAQLAPLFTPSSDHAIVRVRSEA